VTSLAAPGAVRFGGNHAVMLDGASVAGGGMAAELTERVLRRFMRGGTWPGLAREIAWQAVCRTGAEHGWLDWLSDLVEQRLAQRLDGLEPGVARACATAGLEHLRTWPHDVGGGETAVLLGGREQAAQELARVYVETFDWAQDLIRERAKVASKQRRRGAERETARVRRPALACQRADRAPNAKLWLDARSDV
jgi:hypothetical protein